jgi:hypothetical protein
MPILLSTRVSSFGTSFDQNRTRSDQHAAGSIAFSSGINQGNLVARRDMIYSSSSWRFHSFENSSEEDHSTDNALQQRFPQSNVLDLRPDTPRDACLHSDALN